MKVLVTGAGGQLGRELLEVFDAEVVGLDSGELDIADAEAVGGALSEHAPDVVVNAAAYTRVDAAEAEPDAAWAVNAAGPWHLALACRRRDAALVHVSTDYVFDGTSDRPYTEFDAPNPLSVYGRTKHAGEELVREGLARHWIVRTSWVQGRHGNNFVKTMLRLGRERDALSVVADQWGSPTVARDLAVAIAEIVALAPPYGTYHRTNSGTCSWYDLAGSVFEAARIEVTLAPTTTAEYAAPAPRPANSRLDNRKAAMAGLTPLPAWEESVGALVRQLVDDQRG